MILYPVRAAKRFISVTRKAANSGLPRLCRLGSTPYTTRHGFGYTIFEHIENGVRSELNLFVAIDAPVKFAVLKVSNESDRTRRLSATGYWEWVLGELRNKSLMHVITELDSRTGAIQRTTVTTQISPI